MYKIARLTGGSQCNTPTESWSSLLCCEEQCEWFRRPSTTTCREELITKVSPKAPKAHPPLCVIPEGFMETRDGLPIQPHAKELEKTAKYRLVFVQPDSPLPRHQHKANHLRKLQRTPNKQSLTASRKSLRRTRRKIPSQKKLVEKESYEGDSSSSEEEGEADNEGNTSKEWPPPRCRTKRVILEKPPATTEYKAQANVAIQLVPSDKKKPKGRPRKSKKRRQEDGDDGEDKQKERDLMDIMMAASRT